MSGRRAHDSPRSARSWVLVALFLVALGLRTAFVTQSEMEAPFRSDAGEHARYAWNLLHHGTFSRADLQTPPPPEPDGFRSPGYPLLLALVLWAAPEHALLASYLLQALLSALLVPLCYGIGRHFLPGWAALSAAGLVALSPHLVTLCGYLLTEIPYAFLLSAALLAFAAALRRGGSYRFALAGVGFGLAAWVNATAVALPFLAALAAIATQRAGRTPDAVPRRSLAVMVAVAMLFPAAWALRNSWSLPEGARTGGDRLLSTAIHGSYPGWVHRDPRLRYYAYREDPRWPEMRRSPAAFARVLWERVRERPGRYLLWYLAEKPATLWTWSILQGDGDVYVYKLGRSWYDDSRLGGATLALMRALHPLLLVIAVLGFPLWAFRLAREEPPPDVAQAVLPNLLLATGVFATALYTLTAPWPRYAIPLRPLFYLWVMWTLAGAASLWRQRQRDGGLAAA